MPQNVAEFQWWIPPRGYRWTEPAPAGFRPVPPGADQSCELSCERDPRLAEVQHGHEEHGRWYVPDSGLFRSFADLDGSTDALLAFANRFGCLGLVDLGRETAPLGGTLGAVSDQRTQDVAPARTADPPPTTREYSWWSVTDDTLAGWWLEIASMRMCIDLHDALRSEYPHHQLRWHFTFPPTASSPQHQERVIFEYRTEREGEQIKDAPWSARVRLTDATSYGRDPDEPTKGYWYDVSINHFDEWIALYDLSPLYEHSEQDGVIEFAELMLSTITNAHLSQRIDTMVLHDPRRRRPVLFTMPNSLIGALWLQLAQAIDGNKQFRQCASCRMYFELAPDKARSDKEYCSQACRSRAYRARRRSLPVS